MFVRRASAAAVGEPQYSATRAKVKTWRYASRLVQASFLTMYLLQYSLRVARLAAFTQNKNNKIIYGLRLPQFVVAEGHNIFEVTERLFAVGGHHSSLWPKVTTFEKSEV